MKWITLLPVAGIALSACTTVVDEKQTQAYIQRGFNAGKPYIIRTRTLEGPQGQFEQTSVVFRGTSAVCRIDSPNDCALAAESLANNYAFGGVNSRF